MCGMQSGERKQSKLIAKQIFKLKFKFKTTDFYFFQLLSLEQTYLSKTQAY